MIPTTIIAFREFLEVFLIIGVFFGLSKKLKLGREREMFIASLVGIVLSFLLPTLMFLLGDRAGSVINEKNADLLEGYLMIFSGFFLTYVIFSLHKFFVLKRSGTIIKAHQKMEQNIFDMSLFATIVFFIVREGFEIALFTATTSLFSKFMENLAGLVLGFVMSSIAGVLTYMSYVTFPVSRIYKATEYLIIFIGAAFVKNGSGELLEHYYNIRLSNIMPVNLSFLPNSTTIAGHMLKTIIGIEQNFSFAMFLIMAIYITATYLLLIRKPTLANPE
jgi:FTR1 family protein